MCQSHDKGIGASTCLQVCIYFGIFCSIHIFLAVKTGPQALHYHETEGEVDGRGARPVPGGT